MKVICPQCVVEGKTSCIRTPGGGTKTLMASQSFYDEEGNDHYHNPNRLCEPGKCSNGHSLTILHSNRCVVLGCVFGEDVEIKVLKEVKGL